MTRLLGPIFVLIFALSQAVRDVYFARAFQGIDFFAVVLIAFAIATIVFGGITLLRTPEAFGKLRREFWTVAAMNLTTAIAWSCYFFALSHLEPAVVNTIHSGFAPLTVLALSVFWPNFSKREAKGVAEYGCYAGLVLSLLALAAVVLSVRSGIPLDSITTGLESLGALAVSGTSITISLLISKRLHDRGIGADAVTAVRYWLLIVLAAVIEATSDHSSGIDSLATFSVLAVAAALLIALPTFVLQAGIARSAPLTGQIIRSLGPVFVFALEQLDQRIAYAMPSLVCILAYSVFVTGANLAHGWHAEARPAVLKAMRG